MSEERPFGSLIKCHKCGHECSSCSVCGKPCCSHCGFHCDCPKIFPDFKKECNLCEKLREGQCVLILTKNNNFIIGRVDRISHDCTTLKLENSIALPTCVLCALLTGGPLATGVESAQGGFGGAGTICDFLAIFLPFDSFVCCKDIDTVTVLEGPLFGGGFLPALAKQLGIQK